MKIPAVPPLPAARGPELLHRVRGGRAPHPALRGQQHLRRPDPDLLVLRQEAVLRCTLIHNLAFNNVMGVLN